MKKSSPDSGISRRRFLAAASLAVAAPTIIPASALGREDEKPAASERITLGGVGWGMQGPANTDAFLREKNCQVVAACDLDKNHLDAALNKINRHYVHKDYRGYQDFREMM